MRTLVVIGYGMVAHRLVEALVARDVQRQWRIVVLAEEARPAYDRVALSSYVDSWDAEALALFRLNALDATVKDALEHGLVRGSGRE